MTPKELAAALRGMANRVFEAQVPALLAAADYIEACSDARALEERQAFDVYYGSLIQEAYWDDSGAERAKRMLDERRKIFPNHQVTQ